MTVPRELREQLGEPAYVVVLRSGEQWRYAVHGTRNVADGRLAVAPDAPVEDVRRAAAERVEEWTDEPVTIAWEVGPDGVWSGQVTRRT